MNVLEMFKSVKGVVFDVDGVFTSSHMLITENGDLLRSMSTRDGWALKKLIQNGYPVCIITGGSSEGVRIRFERLGVQHIYSGSHDKIKDLNDWLEKVNLQKSDLLYMGDDIPDLAVLKVVGLSTCPSDAAPEIQAASKYISPYKGGEGCVRDVLEKIMKTQGCWPV